VKVRVQSGSFFLPPACKCSKECFVFFPQRRVLASLLLEDDDYEQVRRFRVAPAAKPELTARIKRGEVAGMRSAVCERQRRRGVAARRVRQVRGNMPSRPARFSSARCSYAFGRRSGSGRRVGKRALSVALRSAGGRRRNGSNEVRR